MSTVLFGYSIGALRMFSIRPLFQKGTTLTAQFPALASDHFTTERMDLSDVLNLYV